jgi:hypothetical protein
MQFLSGVEMPVFAETAEFPYISQPPYFSQKGRPE